MYPVVITDAALSDLDSAIRYIALTLENPSAAAKMLDDFDNLAATLEDGAEGFLLVRDEVAAAAGYRWTQLGNYMVFFRCDKDANAVYIERIAYKRRDWVALIQ